jgi:hypothetical protein
MEINLHAAWVGILLGIVAGAVIGIFFHGEQWLGGYGSWRRRMLRLAHISFFGLAFINLAFFFSVSFLGIKGPTVLPSRLFVVGAATMPAVCYLSAFKKSFRHLFFIPVLSLTAGAVVFIFGALLR